MTIRTLAAAAALVAFAPVAAHAGPDIVYVMGPVDVPLDPRTTGEISCEPEGIDLSGLNSDFIGAGGAYVQADGPGASQALCWNKADGSNASVGQFYGW